MSNTAAKQIFALLEPEDAEPRAIAEREGLLQVRDDARSWAGSTRCWPRCPTRPRASLGGEKTLQGVLVGAVMKKSKGSADPKKVNQLLAARCSS